MTAVAYLRKSRVTTDRTVSWEVQETAVRQLAADHGDSDVLILSDWNKSGRKGASGRPGYARLLEMVDAGEVHAIYSYSLSRLSRSLSEFTRLVELATEKDIPVRLHVERHLDIGTATGRLIVNILGAVAQMEAEIAQERARDAIAVRRERGDDFGVQRYGRRDGEELDTLIATFEETGSYRRTAIELNRRGVPSRSGKPWMAGTIRNILVREAPELVPPKTARGAVTRAPFRLARLLRCPFDGRLLTGMMASEGTPRYGCTGAYSVEGHGKRYVSERKVLGWVKAEAARLRTPERVEVATGHEAKLRELEGRRERLVDAWEAGTLVRDDYLRRIAALDETVAQVEQEWRVVDVPEVDWDWEPRAINGVLRAMWDHVELDEQLQPVRAEWRVPEWRA